MLAFLRGDHRLSAADELERVSLLFSHGNLKACQESAADLATRFEPANPQWAARFRLVEAESALWRGLIPEALRLVSVGFPPTSDRDITVERLSLLGMAHAHLHQFDDATQDLVQGQALCSADDAAGCVGLLRARASLATERAQYQAAYRLYALCLASARKSGLRWEESVALMNLGATSLRVERFDQAIDWLREASRVATDISAQDILANISGNLGWAYYRLGEPERALDLYTDAERRALLLGDSDDAIAWLTAAGYAYQDFHDSERALKSYQSALDLARELKNEDHIVNSLEDLAHVSIDEGRVDRAEAYLRELEPLVRKNANSLDALDLELAKGRIAAARHDLQHAETLLRAVDQDPDSQVTMRLAAEHEMARLFETGGRPDDATSMYLTALITFEGARAQLKSEDFKLPFLANATHIYDDYIHFLVAQGKPDEALAAADQSRARTLIQGLGIATNKPVLKPAALRAGEIAQKTGATLLFYWLGEKQSYLWAITPLTTRLIPLPAQAEIVPMVERYRKAVLQTNHGGGLFNEDGLALYRVLLAPAADLIRPDGNVVIVSDGPLSLLNFETLIVPGAAPHYWIEDANLISAPSLYMLASAKPSQNKGRKLLLLGDAVSPNPDYPNLPMASTEMGKIERHFASGEETVFARQAATSDAYIGSKPQQYTYIHFVAHGVASSTDPLDSAIILSRTSAAEDSFKLHAREILRHAIDARLVTISACYGGGTRSYAGEGLVGLSWAFLHAGAHNVIGALWEASDDSTPALMDDLYQGLEEGMAPSAALRRAKLALLHSKGEFQEPFYWAPFQIYTGL